MTASGGKLNITAPSAPAVAPFAVLKQVDAAATTVPGRPPVEVKVTFAGNAIPFTHKAPPPPPPPGPWQLVVTDASSTEPPSPPVAKIPRGLLMLMASRQTVPPAPPPPAPSSIV